MTRDALPLHIRAFLESELSTYMQDIVVAKSAQQQVWIVRIGDYQTKDWTINDHRVVVRVWKGASRWWNLNYHGSLQDIATAEVWGYRYARSALENLVIPRVLYFCETGQPWAIFEYVGEPQYVDWTTSMVKVREEFGFLEPHPRWGRVPANHALDYAIIVLEDVILPLHRQSRNVKWLSAEQRSPKTYNQMVSLYHKTYELLMNDCKDNAGTPLRATIHALDETIRKMPTNMKNLEPVLCHMDLQPQNIMFASKTKIRTVLDWEEAEYADPRFELLLLGRKVCANKNQAIKIWSRYEKEMGINLGSIEPWLNLETVHSLTTLLLQSFSGGGRSPWESQPELLRKLERELQRLDALNDIDCRLAPAKSVSMRENGEGCQMTSESVHRAYRDF